MHVDIRYRPSFAIANLSLAPGEPCYLQSGSIVSYSPGVQIEAKSGGLAKSLGRAILAGESLFMTLATAPREGAWINAAPTLPGDIITLQIAPQWPYFVTRSCWLGHSAGVQVDTKWGGAQSFFGGEGGFGSQVSGEGLCVVSAFGALDHIDLKPGEPVTIDTGHVVAYTLNMQFRLRREGKTMLSALTTGEGLVFDFVGPGRVYTQTRSPAQFANFIRAHTGS